MLSEAGHWGNLDGMKFLHQLGDTIVTRELLIAAAANRRCAAKMLRLLWDHSLEIEPCVGIFMEAAGFYALVSNLSSSW